MISVSWWAKLLTNKHIVLALLALWLLATLGVRPLLLPDEGRYASVAREMLLGDSWLPTLNGLPFFHKPPLMYWIDMAAMSVLGVNPLSARMASMVGAWLMGAALYLDLHRRWGTPAALAALAVLATCPFFFIGAQYANLDMLVAGLITVAITCALRATDDPQRTASRWVVASWCACAFAVLAKGLIGIVLPALVVVPWLLAQRRWRQVIGLMHPLALLAFALIAAPWFVAMHLRFAGFLDYFFMEQHVRRFAQTSFNNIHAGWFYFAVLPLLTLPWSLWLPLAVKRLWQRRSAWPIELLYAWWIVVVVGFFSLPSSKLAGYVMPALPPLAALLACVVARSRAWRWVLPGAALACLSAVAVLAWKAPNSHRDVAFELAARIQPGDRVVFVDQPFFDIPFYAGLAQPAVVLSQWDDPEIPKHDDWRKELVDAARFDPALGRLLLWRSDHAAELLCAPGNVWFVADPAFKPGAELPGLTPIFSGHHAVLLRAIGGRRPGCP